MSLLAPLPGSRPIRAFLASIATGGVLVASVLVAGPVSAATVDLVVNVSSDRGVYDADGTATYTVRVDNRGAEATSVPSTVTLTAPNTSAGTAAWESTVTCVAANGAVCPTGPFTRSNTVISGVIPSIPIAGSLVFTVRAPGNAANFVRDSVAITATIAPTTGDTDSATVTDSSTVNILINDPRAAYTTTTAGPSTVPAESVATYDVVISNTGTKDSVYTDVTLATGIGTGTASTAPIPGVTFTGISCLNETGGALCANLRQMAGGTVFAFQPSPLTASGTSTSWGVIDMPTASSVTLRFTATTGRPVCTDAPTAADRTITLKSVVDAFLSVGWNEPVAQEADNTAITVTTIPALPCATGDISTVTLTQPTAQQSTGVVVGGPFEYTALYSNLAGDAAIGADITFTAVWPGLAGTIVSGSPVCVPSSGAVCPTAWVASGATVRGSGADLPLGGSLSITYSGTGGADNPGICRPQIMRANTLILPPLSFKDTNYVANSVYTTNQQTFGNNARQVATTTNVGSPCTDSHDDAVQQSGPFTDQAATIPLIGPLTPGQVVYFRSSLTNQSPSPAYSSYSLSQSAQLPTSYFTFSDNSDATRWFRHQPADAAGLPFRDDDAGFSQVPTVPFDTGVRCESLGGAVCPTELGSSSGSGGGGQYYMTSWGTYWKAGTQPAMPAGSSLSFVSTYKVPELNVRYQEAGCVPIGVNYGTTAPTGSNTLANVTIQSNVQAFTTPATRDRNAANDITSLVLPLEITRCDNPLTVTKTALTSAMPADRLVKYKIVATNTSVNALDLPRVIDIFSTDAPATISCDQAITTGGALCPAFTPQKGTRYLGDGTTGPITFRQSTATPLAQFDFAWGAAGQPTMPPGSTVTFEVAVQYPTTYSGAASNTVYFTADPGAGAGSWTIASASASVTTPQGSALALAKTVTPVAPKPGGLVTFSVDIVNSGAAVPSARFVDAMNAILAPTNPSGFSNLQCRPLTSADDVLDPTTALGTVACPNFTSNATGINGVIANFAANSGLRLAYTAVAPLTAGSIPNLAVLTQSDTAVTRGDTYSQANFLVMTARISGTVWDDADGSAAGTFDDIDSAGENPTNAGGLNAVLVDAVTGEVVAVVPVNPDGTYLFESAPVLTDVTVAITSANPAPGDPFTTSTLPAGWVATSPLAQATFNTGVTETIEKDFGIEQPPTTDDKTDPLVPNPGGAVQVQVPSLTGDDPEDGELGSTDTFQIVTLPVGGVLYYDGVPVSAGQTITGYDPAKLTVDPNPGAVTVIFTVVAIDTAGVADPTPATITMPFSVADAASISGVVWFDQNGNGVRDPGEVGIAGVTVTLRGVDESGAAVLLTTVTDAAGAYSFPNLAPGTYQVREGDAQGYADGTDVPGTGAQEQGSVDNDGFLDIVLVGGQAAIAYDFGEILAPAPVMPTVPAAVTPPSLLAITGYSGVGGLIALAMLLAGAGVVLTARSRRRGMRPTTAG